MVVFDDSEAALEECLPRLGLESSRLNTGTAYFQRR
jgi:hypothetical protein